MGGEPNTYQNWKELEPRQKAVWPGRDKGYVRRQVEVTVSLDEDLARWLIENVVGRTSFASDLEETVVTALQTIRGELPVAEIEQLRRLGEVASRAGKSR